MEAIVSNFHGIVRYEYRMSIRRRGLWLAFGLLYLFYGFSAFAPGGLDEFGALTEQWLWQYAGQSVFMTNLFMPLVAGIIASDRLVRDNQLGTIELLRSTQITRWQYVLGKYVGVLLSILSIVLITKS
jgi:ABC-type transport system involved in multi-copper enzyme maturation permease subunit